MRSAEAGSPVVKASPARSFWRRLGRGAIALLVVVILVGVGLTASLAGLSPSLVAMAVLLAVIAHLAVWVVLRLLRRLLWRVGARLSFTYFLVGVLPIPMVILLLGVATYLAGGFFLGHLFRESLRSVQSDVTVAAEVSLGHWSPEVDGDVSRSDVALAYYRDGRRVGGDERAPELWPEWIEERQLQVSDPTAEPNRLPPLIALDEGVFTVAATARDGSEGVVAFFDGHLETRLRELSGAWIELVRFDEDSEVVSVTILGERFAFQPVRFGRNAEDRAAFLSRGGADPSMIVQGFDLVREVVIFDTGEVIAESVSVSVAGTTTFMTGQLFSNSREVDTRAWLVFMVPAFLLFDIFAVAWIMALLMIVGLSHAVNRLSRATEALQAGDFSVRIPVRRRDQIGALQTSFNAMAESLERSVASQAQKESLEKELEVARDLQKSLIPAEVVHGSELEFATFFEPSAAIGGDYFDILHLDQHRVAVVIADVSGHGLSAGLRMAMIKAALLILVQGHDDSETILRQLDRVVRSSDEGHSFVTATLALLDLRTGRLELTNAGHPPTYVLRNGDVREIVLPGNPLGALGHSYGSEIVELEIGDTVVWLSDGFIEATNRDGELFGYERTASSLEGDSSAPSEVRDRLLGTVDEYTLGQPAEDDRTLVVMRYLSRPAEVMPQSAVVG